MRNLKQVTVVVSAYSKSQLDHVLKCVDSLRKQVLMPKEILLVLDNDQGLVDFYSARVPSNVKIIVSRGHGLSEARNAGARNAHSPIIAFIDDDAIAEKDWLENLMENYNDPSVVGVGGLVKPLWENKRPAWFPEELDWIIGCSYKGLPRHKVRIRNPIGCNMSFRKTVFETVGYFRSDIGRFGKRLLSGEEAEISIRILEKSPYSKIMYDPSAVVYHRVQKNRMSIKYLLERSFNEGVSKALITSRQPKSLRMLSTEDQYLGSLLRISIPSMLGEIFRFENLASLTVLVLSTCAVFAGFSLARIERR